MLLHDLKDVRNGRVITKDVISRDFVRPGLVEIGKTLFYHGREGDVISVSGDNIVLDIDGEIYKVKASECSAGTTGDSKTKDKGVFSPGQPVYWTYGWKIRNAVIVKKISSDRYDIKWNNGIFEVNVDDLFDDKEAAKKYIGDSKTKDEGHTVQYNGWKINLVNRGSHWEGEAFHNENMRKKMLSSEGSDFSRVKQDLMNQIDMQTNDSKTKDVWIDDYRGYEISVREYGKDVFEFTIQKNGREIYKGVQETLLGARITARRLIDQNKVKDSKSVKDQIAELECQKEQAKKQGYGTDAYDAAIAELQKDDAFEEEHKGVKIYSEPSYAGDRRYYFKGSAGDNIYHTSLKTLKDQIDRQGSSKDSKTKDDYTYPEDFIQFGWNLRQNGSKLIATRGTLKYEGSPYEIVPKLKRWLTDYTLEQKYGSKDSKTKDDSRSERAYDEGYEMALQGKPFSANPYKDVSRSGYADLKESWEDGYRDGRSGKSSNRFRHHH